MCASTTIRYTQARSATSEGAGAESTEAGSKKKPEMYCPVYTYVHAVLVFQTVKNYTPLVPLLLLLDVLECPRRKGCL